MPLTDFDAAPPARERDLDLSSGRVHAHEWRGEAEDAGLVLCAPGLSSNACGFERIAGRLVQAGRRVVALDLRGRGRSETTPPGTYGWPAHARDLVEAATALGADRFDLVGHSMGAYVAMQTAADHPERVSRLVLIDGAGVPEPASLGPIGAGLRRLDRWHPSEDAYVAAVRAGGVVTPWNDLWERFYRYELERRPDGQVRSRTSLAAVLEDVQYGQQHPPDALWPGLRGPVLLLRASLALGDSGGFIVAAGDAVRFAAEVSGASVVPVEANHFGVMADPGTLAAIAGFLG